MIGVTHCFGASGRDEIVQVIAWHFLRDLLGFPCSQAFFKVMFHLIHFQVEAGNYIIALRASVGFPLHDGLDERKQVLPTVNNAFFYQKAQLSSVLFMFLPRCLEFFLVTFQLFLCCIRRLSSPGFEVHDLVAKTFGFVAIVFIGFKKFLVF